MQGSRHAAVSVWGCYYWNRESSSRCWKFFRLIFHFLPCKFFIDKRALYSVTDNNYLKTICRFDIRPTMNGQRSTINAFLACESATLPSTTRTGVLGATSSLCVGGTTCMMEERRLGMISNRLDSSSSFSRHGSDVLT